MYNNTMAVDDILKQMADYLESRSSIADTLTVPGESQSLMAEHERLRNRVEEIYIASGIEIPTEHISSKKIKNQSREAERKKKKHEQRQEAKSHVSNPYSMLQG